MRNRHRAALRNLLLELWDHTARAAQHIAKSNCLELRAWRDLLQRLAGHLGQALACAHHVGRVDGFIGGNQHEMADLMTDRSARARHSQRAKHIDVACEPSVNCSSP